MHFLTKITAGVVSVCCKVVCVFRFLPPARLIRWSGCRGKAFGRWTATAMEITTFTSRSECQSKTHVDIMFLCMSDHRCFCTFFLFPCIWKITHLVSFPAGNWLVSSALCCWRMLKMRRMFRGLSTVSFLLQVNSTIQLIHHSTLACRETHRVHTDSPWSVPLHCSGVSSWAYAVCVCVQEGAAALQVLVQSRTAQRRPRRSSSSRKKEASSRN